MTTTEDTEITLGTGKMLGVFFGLVVLCAVFFGLGFKLGRNSAAPVITSNDTASTAPAANGGVRPSASKSTPSQNAVSQDLAFYKSSNEAKVDQPAAETPGTSAAASTPPSAAPASDGKTASADPAAPPVLNGYYVQVAAVSKQEDGEALVDALKKKQYPAFSSLGADKLFHIQVGPFADVKNAEEMRGKLVSDGYNPILKK